jgi:hypothetical protein
MKKILILILGVMLLAISCCKKPQGTPVDPTVWLDAFGNYKTENVIIVDTALSKAEICDSIATWLQKADIQVLSSDTCVFICSGKYPVTIRKEQGTVKYNLTLTAFDSRFKFVHTGFTYNDQPLEKAKKRDKILDSLNVKILNDMNSLAKYLKESQ